MCSINKRNEIIKPSNEDFKAYIEAANFGHLFPYSISGMMLVENLEKIKNKMDKI